MITLDLDAMYAFTEFRSLTWYGQADGGSSEFRSTILSLARKQSLKIESKVSSSLRTQSLVVRCPECEIATDDWAVSYVSSRFRNELIGGYSSDSQAEELLDDGTNWKQGDVISGDCRPGDIVSCLITGDNVLSGRVALFEGEGGLCSKLEDGDTVISCFCSHIARKDGWVESHFTTNCDDARTSLSGNENTSVNSRFSFVICCRFVTDGGWKLSEALLELERTSMGGVVTRVRVFVCCLKTALSSVVRRFDISSLHTASIFDPAKDFWSRLRTGTTIDMVFKCSNKFLAQAPFLKRTDLRSLNASWVILVLSNPQ